MRRDAGECGGEYNAIMFINKMKTKKETINFKVIINKTCLIVDFIMNYSKQQSSGSASIRSYCAG